MQRPTKSCGAHICSLLSALVLLISTSAASADDFSFTGSLSDALEIQLFDVTLNNDATVSLFTYSWAGGMLADGTPVSSGGFDPIIHIFDNSGALIAFNDDGVDVPPDPIFDSEYDSALEDLFLAAGNYTVSLSVYPNFAVAADSNGVGNIAEGFLCFGCGASFESLSDEFALDILNVDSAVLGSSLQAATVPLPAAVWLFMGGLGILVNRQR